MRLLAIWISGKRLGAAMALILLLSAPSIGAIEGLIPSKSGMVSVLSAFHSAPGASYWKGLDQVKAFETLKEILGDYSLPSIVRSRAFYALTRLKFPGSQGLISEYMKSMLGVEKDNYVKGSALDAFGRLAGDGAVSELAAGLNSDSSMTRMIAAKRLSIIGTPKASEALKSALESQSEASGADAANRRKILLGALENIQKRENPKPDLFPVGVGK